MFVISIFFLPLYRLKTLLFQPFVATGEMVVSEPSATVGGEGRRVDGLKNEVLLPVDETLLVARIAAPKQEDNMWAFTGDGLDDGIRELLPSFRWCEAATCSRTVSVALRSNTPCSAHRRREPS